MKRRIILFVTLTITAWVGLSWFFMWPPISRNRCPIACFTGLYSIDAGAEQNMLAYCNSNSKTSWTHWDYECVLNLYEISEIKKQWAHANHKTNGDDVVPIGVNDFFGSHYRTVPLCPDGGRYNYNRIGEYPTCTFDGKMLSARPPKTRTSLFTWASALYNPEPHRHCANLTSELAKAIEETRRVPISVGMSADQVESILKSAGARHILMEMVYQTETEYIHTYQLLNGNLLIVGFAMSDKKVSGLDVCTNPEKHKGERTWASVRSLALTD